MFWDKSKDVPAEIKKAGMSEWYASLNDVNRVKLGRYIHRYEHILESGFLHGCNEKGQCRRELFSC